MIFLIAYASVAVVMIGVQWHRLHEWAAQDICPLALLLIGSITTAAIWPITGVYIITRYLSSRPPACACGLRGRKGGKFCARCGSKIGAKV